MNYRLIYFEHNCTNLTSYSRIQILIHLQKTFHKLLTCPMKVTRFLAYLYTCFCSSAELGISVLALWDRNLSDFGHHSNHEEYLLDCDSCPRRLGKGHSGLV